MPMKLRSSWNYKVYNIRISSEESASTLWLSKCKRAASASPLYLLDIAVLDLICDRAGHIAMAMA